MTEPHPDLTASEQWAGSLERSRRRRAVSPRLRRKVAARKRHAGIMVVAVLAGSGGSLAIAGLPTPSPSQPGAASGSAELALGRVGQRDLRLGSSGAAVFAVERRLRQLGYAVEPDRYFDRGTHRAVRSFQNSESLRPDGIVGPATWRALFPAGSGAPTEAGSATLASAGGSPSVEGSRTRFAVRMAAPGELSSGDREGLGLGRPPLGSEGGGEDAALIAVEFEDDAVLMAGASAPEAESELPEPARDPADQLSTVDQSGSEGEPDTRSEPPSRQPEGTGPSGGAPKAPIPEPPSAPARSGAGVCGSERMIAPVKGAILTSSYRSAHRPNHAGIDLAAPDGTPIRSVACGIVSFLAGTAQSGGYGNYICVKHSSRLTTCYAHLSRFSDERVGDRVRRGEVIGYVGNTGHSTGPHLHFEVRSANPYGRNDVDPAPYLGGRPIPGTRVGSSAIGGPDLASTPQRQPSTTPGVPTPGEPRAADAPAGGPPTSALSHPAAERMDGASATLATDGGSAAGEGGHASSEQPATTSLQATQASGPNRQSWLERRIGGAEDRHGLEAESGGTEETASAGSASVATEARTDSGNDPEGETQTHEPPSEIAETGSEDGTSGETPADGGGGLEANRGTVGSLPGAEGDDSAPAPGPRAPIFGPQGAPLGGVDPLLAPGGDPAPPGLP